MIISYRIGNFETKITPKADGWFQIEGFVLEDNARVKLTEYVADTESTERTREALTSSRNLLMYEVRPTLKGDGTPGPTYYFPMEAE